MSSRVSTRSASGTGERGRGHRVRPSSSPMGRAPLPNAAVFVNGRGQLHWVPLGVINRPIMQDLDEGKVQQFMDDMENGDEFPPIELLRVVIPPQTGAAERRYYFSFGGCHRYEAHRRLGRRTIKCKIIDSPLQIIRQHLGASCPF